MVPLAYRYTWVNRIVLIGLMPELSCCRMRGGEASARTTQADFENAEPQFLLKAKVYIKSSCHPSEESHFFFHRTYDTSLPEAL
jgi:hypothetical protein